MTIRIPPLRERPDDNPVLVREFLQEFCQRYGYPVPHVPVQTMDVFLGHSWPGNVRELRNAVERCVILGRGESIRVEWLRDLFDMAAALRDDTQARQAKVPQAPRQRLAQARQHLDEVLNRHPGNLSAAARELGVTRKTLYSWLGQQKEKGSV